MNPGYYSMFGAFNVHDYTASQLGLAVVCAGTALVLLTYLWLRQKYERTPPVIVGTILAFSAASTFVWSSWAASHPGSLRVDTISEIVKDAPPLLILCYVCYLAARRFPGARDRKFVRRLFKRTRWLLPSAGLLVLAVGVSFPYAVYDFDVPLPIRSLTDLLMAIPMLVIAGLLTVIFIGASFSDPPGFRRRLQSATAAVGMLALVVIYLLTAANDILRVAGTSAQITNAVQILSTVQNTAIGIEAVALGIAITCYCSQGKLEQFTETFWNLTTVTGVLTRVIENAPTVRSELSLQYHSLLRAANGGSDFDFPSLAPEECCKADDSYRIMLMESWHEEYNESQSEEVSAEYLLHLASVYDEELKRLGELEAALCIEEPKESSASTYPATEALMELKYFDGVQDILELALGTRTSEHRHDPPTLVDRPLWQQLCVVALADSGLLPVTHSQTILNEYAGVVTMDALHRYFHAKNEILLRGRDSGMGRSFNRYGPTQ